MTTSLSAGGTPRLAPADRIGRGLDALSVSHGRALAALLALCLVLFLPGQISLQIMVTQGNRHGVGYVGRFRRRGERKLLANGPLHLGLGRTSVAGQQTLRDALDHLP